MSDITYVEAANTSVASMEQTGIPAKLHLQATDAVKATVEPWIAQSSSQPHWAYKWWGSLPMSVCAGKDVLREDIKTLGPERYAELVFVEREMARLLPERIDHHRARNPEKGYKDLLQDMRRMLADRLAFYREHRADCNHTIALLADG